ncbi:MAG: hypothetical protein BI182_00655 [Acetobacterium sp. MES1]|jgi:hypothetical protein|uniref:DUF4097 domain-containing protein n=1 Tax=Acetobacterium wieringae TaxID=52694 RepID=A0A5D0WVT8_9FIRM|nr:MULTISPECIES: DUF4097 family beta strand repeat-containing protein [Acetobacterium]OXS25617.1 MAG: hypothetical protein BI182_00655 [Acetobacterium sp. MES1]TYC88425.1 DUF4097 domain-containing protein [Acetobacterium wieringae]URN82927.1 DUF4097 domain-containing protein [Acetobacterium wieringae]
MNTNHTWIKYLAIAFGLVLALGIISSIVNGGVALLRGFGFIDNRPPITEQNSHSFKQDFSGKLESVLIKFDAGSITLQSGDTFQVEGTNIPASLTATLDNSKLVIEDQENTNILPNLIGKDKAPNLVVTIPRDTHLKKMELEIGAGRGELLEIITDELILKQGAGEIVADQLQADSGKLNGGAGAVHFTDVQLNDFAIKGGVGLIDIQGLVTGDLEIDCGVGQTSLDINASVNDYFITADQGIGPITINGQNLSETGTGSKSAPHHIDIDGGVGPVNLTFK